MKNPEEAFSRHITAAKREPWSAPLGLITGFLILPLVGQLLFWATGERMLWDGLLPPLGHPGLISIYVLVLWLVEGAALRHRRDAVRAENDPAALAAFSRKYLNRATNGLGVAAACSGLLSLILLFSFVLLLLSPASAWPPTLVGTGALASGSLCAWCVFVQGPRLMRQSEGLAAGAGARPR